MLGKQTHRMQCGMMYNDLDPELMRARQKTMALTTAYAQSYSQSPAKREALLAKILGKIGMFILNRLFDASLGRTSRSAIMFGSAQQCISIRGHDRR